MSSFGARRKAKVIITQDDGVEADQKAGTSSAAAGAQDSIGTSTSKIPSKKPLRASGLRKAFSAADNDQGGENEDDDGPAVVRPALQKKKKPTKSKLSFGANNQEDDEDGPVVVKPSKPAPGLGQRVLENTAMKRNIGSRGLPLRSQQEDDDDRPKYSKEYLSELQSSTPTTPRHTSSVQSDGDTDDMELDPSELEGALVVDSPDMSSSVAKTQILSEAEIREKKERRARLAKEQDFLSVEDDDDESAKKKSDTRLKADDEEIGEGFDNYVEDGGLSLGKRAEKERRKRDRQKMAELITAAEGNDTDSSSDSDDADGRIAYEAAQTRAGMDGLKKPTNQHSDKELLQIPQKITPLPILSDCLGRLQSSLQSMQVDITSKRMAVEQLRKEREGITIREKEVQALLDETGKKYQEAMGQTPGPSTPTAAPLPGSIVTEARGLDSLGTTPSRAPVDDM